MAFVMINQVKFALLEEREQRLILSATRDLQLGEPVIFDDGTGDLWDVYSSLEFSLDDMTLLGSTAEITLPPNKFPFDIADRIYGLNHPYSKDFIWGSLANNNKAPLRFHEDVLVGGEEDPIFVVFDANTKKATVIWAASEIPVGWFPV